MDDIVAYLLAQKKWETAPTYKKVLYVVGGVLLKIWKPLLVILGLIAIIKFVFFG